MVNAHSRTLWALCWLGLTLLVLLPDSASAQRRRRFREDDEDPLCYRSPQGLCQKFHIGVVGGGILSSDLASSGVGLDLAYSWVVAPRFELGGKLLILKDVHFEEGPYVGTAEAMFRVATMARGYQRFFLEFGAGFSRYDSPERAYWAFPCGSGGITYEVSGPGLGLYLSAGMSLLWAEGVTALPHASVGLSF
ncbi:hypothetical protein [Hyalangium versicolor]|uniref:hypothetical protein n=1 Tax=Hyalangium versicolor TaxID=2861190 RepID=UPI001CCB8457|nr:hypothetical protein [Hyalangium versicolor]